MFIYIFLCIFIYSILRLIMYRNTIRGKKILFLTAHPDDEIMFFYPTIKNLCECNDLHLLCLSNGNYDKLGNIREKELNKICKSIKFKNFELSSFEDNIKKFWDSKNIEEIVTDYIKRNKIDIIISFDKKGVSYHPNHISCYLGILRIKNVEVFYLETVNIFRKFIGLFDTINLNENENDIIFTNLNILEVLYYMTFHWSQMKLFRFLFIIFSRYSYINNLKPINLNIKKKI